PAAGLTALLGPPGGIGMTIVEVGAVASAASEGLVDVQIAVDARGGVAVGGAHPLAGAGAGAADAARPRLAESLARLLAPLRLSAEGQDGRYLTDTVPVARLLGIDEEHGLDTERLWRDRPPRERLRVPLGLDAEGEPVILDLKESALSGM